MAQDLTTYMETDPTSRLVVTSDKVTWAGLLQTDGATFLLKDLGVDSIVAGTSVTYLCSNNGSGSQPFVATNLWSNVNQDWSAHYPTQDKHQVSYFRGPNILLRYSSGIATPTDTTAGFLGNVERLVDISRIGQIYTMVIYNGTTVGSGVKDTLVVNAGETPPDFQYHTTCSNFVGPIAGTVTGFSRTYNFTGLLVPSVGADSQGMGWLPQRRLMRCH